MTSGAGNSTVVLTPPGAGAIGVVRVIGPDAVAIVDKAFRSCKGHALSGSPIDCLRYGRFVDGEETIDDVMVCKQQAADVFVDICAHGGVRVIERILQTLERLGATVCRPEEAAGLTWPTDTLIEGEIVQALVRAKTERAVRFLAWQRSNLLPALEKVATLCRSDPERARQQLAGMAEGFPVARPLLEGITVALVGPPNSGKSTLFNRLIGRPATVVSPHPGTTRDWVAEPVEMDGVPVTLVDTAGHWDSPDALERQAVEAGRLVLEQAEIRLLLLDGSQPLSQAGRELLAASRNWGGCVIVMNKADAGPVFVLEEEKRPIVSVSALTGGGCDELISVVLSTLGYRRRVESVSCLFTARQVNAAREVLSRLRDDPKSAELHLKRHLIGRRDEVTARSGGL